MKENMVIPAQAGTQSFRLRPSAKADALGPRLRGDDERFAACKVLP
jgi:hypothetical protein